MASSWGHKFNTQNAYFHFFTHFEVTVDRASPHGRVFVTQRGRPAGLGGGTVKGTVGRALAIFFLAHFAILTSPETEVNAHRLDTQRQNRFVYTTVTHAAARPS